MDLERAATAELGSSLQLAVADAIRLASTRSEHIRLVRISTLVDRLVGDLGELSSTRRDVTDVALPVRAAS